MKRQAFKQGLTYQPWQQYVDSYLQDAHEDGDAADYRLLVFLAQVRLYIIVDKEK